MNFKFIGWCKESKHDKVWGVIKLDSPNALIFWGRRGSKLQTKFTVETWGLTKLIDSKRNTGYNEINSEDLDKVYPEFQQDIEQAAIWASLRF